MAAPIRAMLALGWYMMPVEDQPRSDLSIQPHTSLAIPLLLLLAARANGAWAIGRQPVTFGDAAACAGRTMVQLHELVTWTLATLIVLHPICQTLTVRQRWRLSAHAASARRVPSLRADAGSEMHQRAWWTTS